MIKIQVLGKGMIPRGYGLAPRLEPFYADLTFINTILSTPGLTVRYLNPVTMQFGDIDRKNVKRIYEKYANVDYGTAPAATVQQPHVPDKRVIAQNPASVNGVTIPPAHIPPVTTEVIHTNPPQYEQPKSAAELNKQLHDFATRPAEETAAAGAPDHTKEEEKIHVVVPDEKKEEQAEKQNDTIKPVNAPDNNKNKQNNGGKK